MSALIARRCFVSGHVQGVFYRASTREKATELGLKGSAINLADGRVEVLAIGREDAVERLIEWLHKGPPAARVTHVDVQTVEVQSLREVPADFRTR